MSIVDKNEPGTIYEKLFGWEIEIGPPELGGYGMCKRTGRNAAGIGPPARNPEQAGA